MTSRRRWRSVTWSDIATIIAAAITTMPQCEPGADDESRQHTAQVFSHGDVEAK